MNRVSFLLVVGAILAGCAESPNDNHPQEAESAPVESSSANETIPEAGPIAAITPELEFLNLNQCDGMVVVPSWPTKMVDAHPPPGWNETAFPLTATPLEIYECQRFSLGPFERANVTFLIQTHDNRETPSACAEGVGEKFSISEIIHVVLVDDEEIVRYLLDLGMPAMLTAANSSVEEQETLSITTWTIRPVGLPESELKVANSADPDRRVAQTLRRFWLNQYGGISFIDMKLSVFYAGASVNPVTGSLNEPFLAQGQTIAFGYSGSQFWDSDVTGPLIHFGDLECNEPLLQP